MTSHRRPVDRPTAPPLTPLLVALALLLPLLSPAPARAQDGQPDGDAARAMFESLRAMEGSWRTVSTAGWSEVTRYEVIARGSVVMSSTTFRDDPSRKMVTMFHLDGERLVLTHYCEARNQPHLVADEIDLDEQTVSFRFAGGTNLPDRDHGHMDSVVYRFRSADRVESRWSWYQDGRERWLETVEAARIR